MSMRFASAFAVAANELFDAAMGFVVGHLDGRMLGEKRGGRMQDAADAAIESDLATADGVDGDAGRVWRIFHGKARFNLHGHIAEEAALDSDEGDLVVELPGHIVARANMNVFIGEPL